MAYVTTGKRRSLIFTVIKSEEHPEISGFNPQTIVLNGMNAFPGYALIDTTQLAQLSSSDFNIRKLAYKSYLEEIYISEPLLLASLDWTKCELEASLYINITANAYTLVANAYSDSALTIPENVTQDITLNFSYWIADDTTEDGSITISAGINNGVSNNMPTLPTNGTTFYKSIANVINETHIEGIFNVVLLTTAQYIINGSFTYGRTHKK